METYNYIFWNNQYENLWYAIPREGYLNFFNGKRTEVEGVLIDADILSLVGKIKGVVVVD